MKPGERIYSVEIRTEKPDWTLIEVWAQDEVDAIRVANRLAPRGYAVRKGCTVAICGVIVAWEADEIAPELMPAVRPVD